MAGFTFRERPTTAVPTLMRLIMKDTETLNVGDLLNLEGGFVDLAATADANLVGVCLETVAGTTQVTKVKCVTDPDAIYGVADPVARKIGDTLDIAGATGAQAVAASVNKELVVVADCSALEETLVRINVGKHYQSKAQ